MGYRIHALLVPPGEASAAAVDAVRERARAAAGSPLDPQKEARKRSIASTLATAGLGYEVGEPDYEEAAEQREIPEDEARRRIRHVQVDNGTILIELDEEHALLNLPRSPELDAEKLVDDALETLRILHAEARFVAYDPQLDREIDPDADRDAVLEAYRGAAMDARRSGKEDVVKPPALKSWWRRLRGGR